MSTTAEPSFTVRATGRPIQRARRLITKWFDDAGWKPFAFQRRAWVASLQGQSGLIHATTGTGKTYAAGHDDLRLPCFLRRANTLVLPAFSSFVDHDIIRPQPEDSIYVVANSNVIAV